MTYPGNGALGARLSALASLLKDGPVADIGCDHGLLSAYLAEQGALVIAVDRSEASLQKTRRLAAQLSGLEVRKGDGFSALQPGEAKAAVIAGLGGLEMVRIMQAAPECVRAMERLVLQPMQGQAELRAWLAESGYAVTDERLVQDGRLFEILLVQPGKKAPPMPQDWPAGFYDIGYIPVMRGDAEAGALIERRIRIFSRQLALAQAKGETPQWLARRVTAYKKVKAIYDKSAKV